MSSVRELRRRIQSIKNIGKMTKALQMVASSKIRRAQERVQQSRPYAEHLNELMKRLALAAENVQGDEKELLTARPINTIGMIVITPDRNLCGSLPTTVSRKALKTMQEEQRRLEKQGVRPEGQFIAVGRRGRDFLRRSEYPLLAEFLNYGDWPSVQTASEIARFARNVYLDGEADLVLLVYSAFISTSIQQPVVVQLLPIQPPPDALVEKEHIDPIYEPDPATLNRALLPRYLDTRVYQALLEAIASEQAAQMAAMKQASDNANELVQDLTLVMNKARQASITTQILEVVSGAESLS